MEIPQQAASETLVEVDVWRETELASCLADVGTPPPRVVGEIVIVGATASDHTPGIPESGGPAIAEILDASSSMVISGLSQPML